MGGYPRATSCSRQIVRRGFEFCRGYEGVKEQSRFPLLGRLPVRLIRPGFWEMHCVHIRDDPWREESYSQGCWAASPLRPALDNTYLKGEMLASGSAAEPWRPTSAALLLGI